MVVFGGPRTGKTAVAGRPRARRPGRRPRHLHPHRPATSCARRCARERGPVFVFNAVGLGGIAVDDHVRPADRLRRSGDGDRARHGHARRHHPRGRVGGSGVLGRPGPPRAGRAAARRGARWQASMRDVLGVGRRPGPRRARGARPAAPHAVSRRSSRTSTQFVTTNDRTRTSITSTIMPALGWLTHPAAAAAAEPGATGFDVAELLARPGDGVPARRRGDPGRPAGVRADRAHRPRGPPPRRAAARRPARPAADVGRWTRPR